MSKRMAPGDGGVTSTETASGAVRRVALRDVAAAANVHPSTASRALNIETRDRVSSATVERVLEAARLVGYEPNSLARSLRTSRTYTIGMLIPDLTNPLFPPIVKGIEDRLSQDGFTLVLANTNYDPAQEAVIARGMISRQVDGLLLATARRDYPLVDDLVAAGRKVVLVNRTMEHAPVAAVTGDDHLGIGLAVSHLASLGHRRLAYVGGDAEASTGVGRYQGFVARLHEEGLDLDADLVVHADRFHEEPGAAAFAELLGRGKEFTAVVAANDRLALGCYDVLRERGLRVPQDISVTGYNDMFFVDRVAPPLTTVRIPHYQIGVKAAQLMLEALADNDAPPLTVRLTPSLIVRESTQPPPRG